MSIATGIGMGIANGIGRSIGSVLTDIVDNIREIIGAEIRLAKAEARVELTAVVRGIAWLLAGGMIAFLALGFLLLACVYLLSVVLPSWAAALIVAGVSGVAGGLVIASGLRRLRAVPPALPRTAATLRENLQWAKASEK
jgi:hypothetical protein